MALVANEFTPDLQAPLNPLLYLTDSYKISHLAFEISGVSEIYSNLTARFDKYMKQMAGAQFWDGQYVVFGIQYAILELNELFNTGFFQRSKAVVIAEMMETLTPYINQQDYEHFAALHDLGYLPVQIKALPEGTLAPMGCPALTIRNTHPDFEWLPNYLESILSTLIWKPLTVATVARLYRLQSNRMALKTTGSLEGTEFQVHDFHVRGASGYQSAAVDGCAFLLSSCGSDNLPALDYAKRYYGSTNQQGLLVGSVAAGEHSVTTLGILTIQEQLGCSIEDAETEYLKYTNKKFPTGIYSYVSDSFDYWNVISTILPRLKDEIMSRDGKFVVRGDSGNPVHVIAGYRFKDLSHVESRVLNATLAEEIAKGFEAFFFENAYWRVAKNDEGGMKMIEISRSEAKGTIQCLYETFGGTVNALGYKVLDSHIGMIYGDGITLARQAEILSRLEEKGFVSTSIVFGAGSYSLNLLSRDHLGMAIKATNAVVDINGVRTDKPIYKDPKTDQSKKSAKGLLQVTTEGNKVVSFKDQATREEEATGALRTIYKDSCIGGLETLFTIRDRLWSSNI